jgi:hypothetical protein
MLHKMTSWIRSRLPNLDQVFETGNALSNIALRADAFRRAVEAHVASPSPVTWAALGITTVAFGFSVWASVRVARKLRQENTKSNPSDANQNGLPNVR